MDTPTRRTAPKVLLFANTEWYLYNFRLPLARAARAQGAEVVFVSPPGPHAARLVADGFRWIPVRMSRRGFNPWREACSLLALWRLYRRERPDIAHHFTLKCIVFGGLAARLAGVRRVVSAVTGLGYVFSSGDALARLCRPVISRLLRVGTGGVRGRMVVQNADDRRAVIASGIVDAANVRLIPGSGVDMQRFQPRPATETAQRCTRILFAARLLRDKGLGEVIDAARTLRAAGLPVELLIAGAPDAGNPASFTEQEIAAWRDEKVAAFLGHVNDMAALLATVDAVVLPTTYREGVPRSLIEAAAAGLPIVTTDAPGCRDIVADGHNGFLVPSHDTAALTSAIGRLVRDPALGRRMGANGRMKALAGFDERAVIGATLAVYRELLPAWPAAPAMSPSARAARSTADAIADAPRRDAIGA